MFINFDGDSLVMEKVLSAYGLGSDNLTLLDLTDQVVQNFQHRQNVNLMSIPGASEHIWFVLALVCPAFVNDFAKALHDKQKITLAFLTHVELHLHFGRKACFVQGLFGAGETFTTAMLAFITGAVLGQRMLWVSHNNKHSTRNHSCTGR
jgi:hypothetical protein